MLMDLQGEVSLQVGDSDWTEPKWQFISVLKMCLPMFVWLRCYCPVGPFQKYFLKRAEFSQLSGFRIVVELKL